MSRRPRIGITVHSTDVRTSEGDRETRFEVPARYAQAVARTGGLPLLLPVHPSVAVTALETVSALDGLLVSGGGRVSADYFVAHPNPTLRDTNPPRYDVEVELIAAAWATRLPLLGICRGHQTLVEALGGSLLNDLRTDARNAEHYQTLPATQPTHALSLLPGSLLARMVPDGVMVNSFHRQVVTAVPEGLRATAWSPEGLIEAVEHSEASGEDVADAGLARFAVGCQFHPEWLGESEPGFDRLFDEFVGASRRYASLRETHAAPTRSAPSH